MLFSFRGQATHTSAVSLARTLGRMSTAMPPSTLYKYFPPTRVDVLASLQLRFTPLDEFNDPFEGRYAIHAWRTEEGLEQEVRDRLKRSLDEGYEALPAWQKVTMSRTMFSIAAQPLDAKYKQRYFETYLAGAHKLPTEPLQVANVGALCLTEAPTNALMWSHYADKHTGFVLGLDTRHDWFNALREESTGTGYLRQLTYAHEQVAFTEVNARTNELFLRKSPEWAHEREWRQFVKYSAPRWIDDRPQLKETLVPIPPSLVTSIILGSRISEETNYRIRHAVETRLRHPGLSEKRIKLDRDTFAIHLVDSNAA